MRKSKPKYEIGDVVLFYRTKTVLSVVNRRWNPNTRIWTYQLEGSNLYWNESNFISPQRELFSMKKQAEDDFIEEDKTETERDEEMDESSKQEEGHSNKTRFRPGDRVVVTTASEDGSWKVWIVQGYFKKVDRWMVSLTSEDKTMVTARPEHLIEKVDDLSKFAKTAAMPTPKSSKPTGQHGIYKSKSPQNPRGLGPGSLVRMRKDWMDVHMDAKTDDNLTGVWRIDEIFYNQAYLGCDRCVAPRNKARWGEPEKGDMAPMARLEPVSLNDKGKVVPSKTKHNTTTRWLWVLEPLSAQLNLFQANWVEKGKQMYRTEQKPEGKDRKKHEGPVETNQSFLDSWTFVRGDRK